MEFEVEEGRLGDIPEIEDGTYVAKFVGLEERDITVGAETRKVYAFRFDIEGQIVEGLTTTRRTERSKAVQWLKAIVGSDFKKIKVEDYYGTEVIVTIQNKIRAYGDRNIAIPRVVNVSPLPKKTPKKEAKKKEEKDVGFSIEEVVLKK